MCPPLTFFSSPLTTTGQPYQIFWNDRAPVRHISIALFMKILVTVSDMTFRVIWEPLKGMVGQTWDIGPTFWSKYVFTALIAWGNFQREKFPMFFQAWLILSCVLWFCFVQMVRGKEQSMRCASLVKVVLSSFPVLTHSLYSVKREQELGQNDELGQPFDRCQEHTV